MCVNPNDPVFYVYVYLDPRKPGKYVYGEYMFDYEPFYVGKGSGKRAYVHLHNKNNKDLFERIQSIKTPFIMFYKKRLVEYSAFKLETDIIKAVGKKITNTGPLYNIRDEQGQRTGYEHSDETKKKISESHKGIKHTNETRKRLSESHKGMKHTNETKKKISETKKGKKRKPFTEEHRKRLGQINKGRKHTDESKRKMSNALKGKKFTEEHKQKLSEAKKKMWILRKKHYTNSFL